MHVVFGDMEVKVGGVFCIVTDEEFIGEPENPLSSVGVISHIHCSSFVVFACISVFESMPCATLSLYHSYERETVSESMSETEPLLHVRLSVVYGLDGVIVADATEGAWFTRNDVSFPGIIDE